MIRPLKLLTFAAVLAYALVGTAATAGSTRAAAPMRVTVNVFAVGNDESTEPANLAVRAGGTVQTTSVSFVAPYGVYEWRCMFCDTATHPHTHAMKGKVYAIINA